MRLFRKKDGLLEEKPEIRLIDEDGEPFMLFPGEVIDSVRLAVTRMMRTASFPKKLVTTSAVRQEGVTYLTRAIGAVLAKDFGRKVCVVELNWWWPADYPLVDFGRPGVAGLLMENAALEESLVPTGLENLKLISAGKMAKNTRSRYAGSDELSDLLETVANQFDHVILDIPAVTATSDAILLASLGDALCMVVHQGVTPVHQVKSVLDDLDHLNITGVLMNRVTLSTPTFLVDYIVQA